MEEKTTVRIRSVIDPSELQMVMRWAEAEGWNPGQYDYEPYFAMDRNGYLLLLVEDTPVGSISLVKYSEEFSFIGLFIVLPKYRSKGLGRRLWEEAMRCLEKCATVGLYAVPTQISRYSASGFRGSYMNKRWHREAPKQADDLSHLIDVSQNPYAMFRELCAYDKTSAFKHNREKMLESMLAMPQTLAFVSFNKSKKVNGYGMVRPCIKGYRIGPLYADDYDSATLLFRILLSKIPGESVILDMPETNSFSQIFAEYFNLQPISAADTLAMFKGEEPREIKDSKSLCYGVGSLELG